MGAGSGVGMTALCIQGMREEGADREGMRQSLDLLRLTRDILVPRPSGAREVRPIRSSCRIVTQAIHGLRPPGERKVHPIRLSCRIVTQAIHGLRPQGERKVHPIRLSCRIVSTSPSAPRNDRLVICAKASLSTDGSPFSHFVRNTRMRKRRKICFPK